MNRDYHTFRRSFLILLAVICTIQIQAQTISSFNEHNSCGHDPMHIQAYQNDLDYRKRVQESEEVMYEATLDYLENEAAKNNDEIYRLPIVIHIIHSTALPVGDPDNPSDVQIIRGIDLLNESMRNTGPYAGDAASVNNPNNPDRDMMRSVDTKIEFHLAKQDIYGRPINAIRRYANDDFFDLDFSVEDIPLKSWVAEQNGNSFPQTHYSNIYVVRKICADSSPTSCTIGGYARYPYEVDNIGDGIVVRSEYFGTGTAENAILAHEVGHHLYLHHTFWVGCDIYLDCENNPRTCENNDCIRNGDQVCDTPPDISTTSVNCSTGNTANSCDSDTNSGFTIDQNDMVENYMDYGDFACWNTFTEGQKTRMRVAIETYRSAAVNSKALDPIEGREAGIVEIVSPRANLNCVAALSAEISVKNFGAEEITSLHISAEVGDVSVETIWTGSILSDDTKTITLDAVPLSASGEYTLTINITKVNDIDGDAYAENNSLSKTFNYDAPVREVDACEAFLSTDTGTISFSQPRTRSTNLDIAEVGGCEENGAYAIRVKSWDEGLRTNLKGNVHLAAYDLNIYESPILIFGRSYRQSYSTSHTQLRVLASSDCGENFEQIYQKAGPDLASRSGFQTSEWIPSNCDEWVSDTIDLFPFKGENAVTLRLEVSAANVNNTSSYQWGNNLYIDNICVKESDALAACMIAIDTVESSDPSTCNATDGSIIISANETEGVEYSLNGEAWQTSNTFEGLTSGLYQPQLRKVDVLSCRASSDFITLTESIPPILENIDVTTPTDCSQADGAIEIMATGTDSLEYSIDGMAWQANGSFAGLSAGTYTPSVRYVHAPACVTGASRELEGLNAPEIASIAITNPATCKGVVGEIVIMPVQVDSTAYEYSIDGGATWQAFNTFSDLAAGMYKISIRDAANTTCVSASRNVELIAEADSNISASIEISSDTICTGGFSRLILKASNGRSPYEITYTDGVEEYTAVVIFSSANIIVRPSETTTYSLLSVQDITRCSTQVTGEVTVTVEDCGDGLVDGIGIVAQAVNVGEFYPNPSSTPSVALDVVASQGEAVQIQLFDLTAKLHRLETRTLIEGFNRLQLRIEDLPRGTYFVKLQTTNAQYVRKLVRH